MQHGKYTSLIVMLTGKLDIYLWTPLPLLKLPSSELLPPKLSAEEPTGILSLSTTCGKPMSLSWEESPEVELPCLHLIISSLFHQTFINVRLINELKDVKLVSHRILPINGPFKILSTALSVRRASVLMMGIHHGPFSLRRVCSCGHQHIIWKLDLESR